MAKIVYGVSGEGSGHASRSREMGLHLLAQGHQLRMVSYDRGFQNLKDEFDVFETEGLRIASEDNKVSLVETFTENLKRLPKGHRKLQALRRELFEQFQPDCVITDFEPMTAYLARHYDLPLITIDNQHRMRYLKYDRPPKMKTESRVTKTIIRAMVPKPNVSLVTTFFGGELKNDRTFIFPPIVRDSVLELKPTDGDHVLVYLTSGFDSLLDNLQALTREAFRVYGYDRDQRRGCLQFRPFSQDGFLQDLASSKAVVATAGFTLISEALYLQKPYLALPMEGQFEQQLNAFQLDKLGYGARISEDRSRSLGDFLYRLPDYRQRLEGYQAADNREIKEMLDRLLDDDCALAKEFKAAQG